MPAQVRILPANTIWPALAAYLYCAKVRVLTSLAYRFEVVGQMCAHLVAMLAMVFLWRTAFEGKETVAGVEQGQMVNYAMVSVLLSTLFQSGVQGTIPSRIREGEIAIDLMRPVNPLGCWLADDIGQAVAAFGMQLLPLLGLGTVLARLPLPASPGALAAFLPMCALGFLLNWLLGALVGMIAFWTLELGHTGFVKDVIVRVLSGSIVPLWFFPPWFAKGVGYLPFAYIYQAPLGVYIGRTPPGQALGIVAIQAAWTALLGGVLALVWSRGRRRVLVQGG